MFAIKYEIVCDECADLADSDMLGYVITADDAIEEFRETGWTWVGEQTFCPECSEK